MLAKSEKRSGRWKKYSRSNLGGLAPARIPALEQLTHRRSPLSPAEIRQASSWRSDFCIEAGPQNRPPGPKPGGTNRHRDAPAKRVNHISQQLTSDGKDQDKEKHNVGSRISQTTTQRSAEARRAETCNPAERASFSKAGDPERPAQDPAAGARET